MRRLDTAGTTLLADLDEATRRVSDLLEPETRSTLRATVTDLRQVTRAFARRSAELEAMVASTALLARNGAEASAALPRLVERVERSAAAVERMAESMALAGTSARTALDGVGQAASGTSGAIQRLEAETLPEVGLLVVELRALTASLGRVSSDLERNPGLLLQGRAATAAGPGE
jgi:phospholipid/cholesterol/gamma-HCH transport system substrate-binding protein